jgi:hypothetical protein
MIIFQLYFASYLVIPLVHSTSTNHGQTILNLQKNKNMYKFEIRYIYFFQDIEFDPRLWKWNKQEEMSKYNAKYNWKMFK